MTAQAILETSGPEVASKTAATRTVKSRPSPSLAVGVGANRWMLMPTLCSPRSRSSVAGPRRETAGDVPGRFLTWARSVRAPVGMRARAAYTHGSSPTHVLTGILRDSAFAAPVNSRCRCGGATVTADSSRSKISTAPVPAGTPTSWSSAFANGDSQDSTGCEGHPDACPGEAFLDVPRALRDPPPPAVPAGPGLPRPDAPGAQRLRRAGPQPERPSLTGETLQAQRFSRAVQLRSTPTNAARRARWRGSAGGRA
jgi:hypothetical protein